ncbi:MAG: hypothetical protein COT18_09480 [Elusimicrobia bacterium CG08_land_8_20_14_0_20_59_10]|nr:MAG: hypothetical protein COT18_09480 [Elusimicrobia bacterium CG08_land_8_20_14_0_20_59_10]
MKRSKPVTGQKHRSAGRRPLKEKRTTAVAVREAGALRPRSGAREELFRAAVRKMSAEFVKKFRPGWIVGSTPRERLKNALIAVGKFSRKTRKLAPPRQAEAVPGKNAMARFTDANFTEYVKVVALLAAECRPASSVRRHSIPFMVDALLSVMVFPLVMRETLAGTALELDSVEEETFSDAGIEDRAEIAVRGIGL